MSIAETLIGFANSLTGSPIKQGALAAFCTLFAEDPTTISCGLLVAEHKMGFFTALIGLSIGIAAGDLWLYIVGRYLGPRAVTWGWVSEEKLAHTRKTLGVNLFAGVLVSRFLPGTRIPTFVGAGVLKADPVGFLATSIIASLLWTWCLIHLTMIFGRAVGQVLGPFKWPIIGGVVVLIVGWQILKRVRRRRLAKEPPKAPIASSFEFWPPWLFYTPVGLYYIAKSIRHWSPTLPSCANPAIPGGGIAGESKGQILDLVSGESRRFVAPYTVRSAGSSMRGEEVLARAMLSPPVVAKPDVGQRGAGVRVVRTPEELDAYIAAFPTNVSLMLQKLVPWEREAGVLFYRIPGEAEGKIFSITMKEFPRVTGDGKRTLRELVLADPRLALVSKTYFARHAAKLDTVIDDGVTFPLVFAGNHCQGAIFRDGTHLATDALRKRMQEICDSMNGVYFARFDIRFRDEEAFLAGEEFQIIEINGASAEATHIWDPAMELNEAYAVLFEQFRVLFQIGAINRKKGTKPVSAFAIWKDFRSHLSSAKHYPPTD